MKIAISQASSSPDPEENLKWIKKSFSKAKKHKAELLIFPECILCWAKKDETRMQARSLKNWEKVILPLIEEFKIPTVWGGVQVLERKKIYNGFFSKVAFIFIVGSKAPAWQCEDS